MRLQIDRQARGKVGEDLAALFLGLLGYAILARNGRWADVEVDLLARHESLLVLVEVKLRHDALGQPEDALHATQRRRLRRAAEVLLERHVWAESVRLDLVTIDWRGPRMQLRHLPGVV